MYRSRKYKPSRNWRPIDYGPLLLDLSIARSQVCKKVTKLVEKEVWECDPLLTADEQAALETV